jgi:hypothetical protein
METIKSNVSRNELRKELRKVWFKYIRKARKKELGFDFRYDFFIKVNQDGTYKILLDVCPADKTSLDYYQDIIHCFGILPDLREIGWKTSRDDKCPLDYDEEWLKIEEMIYYENSSKEKENG